MGAWMRVPALAEALAGEDPGGALSDEDVRAGQEALELVEALGIRGARKVGHDEWNAAPDELRVSGGGGGHPDGVETFLAVLPAVHVLPTAPGSAIRVMEWSDDRAPSACVAVLTEALGWITPAHRWEPCGAMSFEPADVVSWEPLVWRSPDVPTADDVAVLVAALARIEGDHYTSPGARQQAEIALAAWAKATR